MSATPQDVRYAPPQTTVEDVAPAVDGLQLASRWRRFSAVLIDLLAQGLAMWLVSLITPWNPWEAKDSNLWSLSLENSAFGFGLFVALQGYLLATRGQTIGKALLGMRITRPGGDKASIARVIGMRYGVGYAFNLFLAAALIFGLTDMVLIFRKSRRCLHDTIADTIVIRV
jgi:uncharacterized RDD family membrane protein YckC